MSSLAKNLKRKLDKNDLNDNNLALLDVTHDKTEVLKISFNGGAAIEVNKEKLLKKSLYFQAITSPRFIDHQKDEIQVNFDASTESFQQIISYVETDDVIKKKNDNVLEVLELATYLQIDCLTKDFKDLFIYNLNSRTIDNQLKIIKNNPLFKDFEEVALKFKENENSSFSALYILESYNDGDIFIRIKWLLNKESGSKLLSQNDDDDTGGQICLPQTKMKIVAQFRNRIIFTDYEFYYQCNLITKVISRIFGVPKNCKICCDDFHLYAIQADVKLKVYYFRSIYSGDELRMYRKTYYNLVKPESIISVVYYNRKIFIMYTKNEGYWSNFDCSLDRKLCCLHMLILCTEEDDVLGNFKINNRLSIDEKIIDESYSSGKAEFLTIFQDKKNLKIFTYTGRKTPILVFDVQKENFYFVENTISGPMRKFVQVKQFCTDYNNNIVYKLVKDFSSGNYKVTAYEFVEEKFVDARFECDYFADWLSMYFV